MKKQFLFLFLLTITSVSIAQNRFLLGVKAGLSASQVSGDNLAGFNKAGLIGGLTLNTKFNNQWGAQLEMLYIQKGSKAINKPSDPNYEYYLLQLDYIEVPLLLQYHQKKFIFEAGPGFGYLVREKEYNAFDDITGIRPFNKSELAINLGVSYLLFNKFEIGWRYTNSISSIRNHVSGAKVWYNPGQQNTVMAFTLTYKFISAKNE
ncbi:MAG: porin family protein [Bacteroidia bacterium]